MAFPDSRAIGDGLGLNFLSSVEVQIAIVINAVLSILQISENRKLQVARSNGGIKSRWECLPVKWGCNAMQVRQLSWVEAVVRWC